MVRGGPRNRRAAMIEMTRTILVRVAATAPRDTNRYVRGWMEAGNAAGVGRFHVPGLNRASRYMQIKKRLSDEIEWWSYIVMRNRNQVPPRHDKWANQAERRLARAQEEYKRFFQAEGGAVIGINVYSALGGSKPVRALPKIYGGTGRIISLEAGRGTVVQLHNKEAHASMVERNTRCMSRAYSAFRGTGLVKIKAAYLKTALPQLV